MAQVVNPVVLEKGLKTTFFKAYSQAVPAWKDLATIVPSSASEEKYGWLGSAPAMQEWVDERVPKGLLSHDYTIVNKHWEASIAVDKDTLADDQTGQINVRVKDLAQRAKDHPYKLISDLIMAGDSASGLCYDGQQFFDTDHSEGSSGTQINQLTATTESALDITTAIAATLSDMESAFEIALK